MTFFSFTAALILLVFDCFNKVGEKYKSNIHLKILIKKNLKQVKHLDEWEKRKKPIQCTDLLKLNIGKKITN